eukprot:6504145-Pyramimonas_sp.AAC.1
MRFGGHQEKAARPGIGIRSGVDGDTIMDRQQLALELIVHFAGIEKCDIITDEHFMERYNTFEWSEHAARAI